MRTILVTGGAGYIGSHTVKELIKHNYNVVVLDSLEAGHKKAVDKKAKLEIFNLSDKEKLDKIFKKYKFDAVIDFAAYLSVGESMEEPIKYLDNNVFNFINLLEAMERNNCKYIIKSSTAATYGNPIEDSDIPWEESFTDIYKPQKSALLGGKWQNDAISDEKFLQKIIQYYTQNLSNQNLLLNQDEISKLRIPLSVYGLTKLLDEIIMDKYNKKSSLNWVALRYFNVSGADPSGEIGEDKPKPTTLMTLCFWQIMGKIPHLQIFGKDYDTPDGTGIRDYIHPSDLAIGHISALEYLFKDNKSTVFNLGTGSGSSVLEVIRAVEKASNKKVKTLDAPKRSGDPSISIADPKKANNILGWQAMYNIDQMAETAWNWHHKHPHGFNK